MNVDLSPSEIADREADERSRARLREGTFRQSNQGGVCLCTGCGRMFAGLRYFDAHRPPPDSDDPCRGPESLGFARDRKGRWFDPVFRGQDTRPGRHLASGGRVGVGSGAGHQGGRSRASASSPTGNQA